MSNIQGMEGITVSTLDEYPVTLDKLPTEVIIHIMGSMLPREVMTFAKISSPMSDFELYVRLVLFDFYTDEMVLYGEVDSKPVAMIALSYAKRLLRRLYQHDPANVLPSQDVGTGGLAASTSTQALLNPYTTASENTHVLARVIADQVCHGACYPESAVLLLQCLCSLHDQNQFQFMVNSQERDVSLHLPSGEERVTIGQLCFQYLVPVILALLQPTLQTGQTPAISTDLFQHLTKILCFLPLLGRHFNTLPTSTFIETFLDRSKGYIPIDKAAVLVYGFMCVLDLETGKANLASDSYRIFERSMPTQGVVQAKEMVRIVERHRALMRGFLLSSPTFSSSPMSKALDLPEILLRVGPSLVKKRDIVACLSVCKTWKAVFEPFLWREFRALPDIPPPLALMELNAEHIRKLTIEQIDTDMETFWRNCTRLVDLSMSAENLDEASWEMFANMIRNHASLRRIFIHCRSPLIPPKYFLQALKSCQRLAVFETDYCNYEEETFPYYLDACAGLWRLSAEGDRFPIQESFPAGVTFSEMRYMELCDCRGMTIEQQLEWISRCPKLISIRLECSNIPVSLFCEKIPSACANLTDLHFLVEINDEPLSRIIDALPRVEKLTLTATGFGTRSMNSLRRHFATLRDINIQYCTSATPAMVQEILASCPKLQGICADYINADAIGPSQPWVCTNLQMFDVHIRVRNSASLHTHRTVYSQLSLLQDLQYLSICSPNPSDLNIPHLRFTLEYGVELLTGFSKLTYFSCKWILGAKGSRDMETVQWIMTHWPRLETFEAVPVGNQWFFLESLPARVQFEDFNTQLEDYDDSPYNSDYDESDGNDEWQSMAWHTDDA
ncbi:hypothetical protein BG003_009667 [Podila horticola]|nr:hypothetical protein BG003_009667 [Podila horticola]